MARLSDQQEEMLIHAFREEVRRLGKPTNTAHASLDLGGGFIAGLERKVGTSVEVTPSGFAIQIPQQVRTTVDSPFLMIAPDWYLGQEADAAAKSTHATETGRTTIQTGWQSYYPWIYEAAFLKVVSTFLDFGPNTGVSSPSTSFEGEENVDQELREEFESLVTQAERIQIKSRYLSDLTEQNSQRLARLEVEIGKGRNDQSPSI